MRYAKPYPRDYRRPEDAGAKLQNSLDDALGKLEDLEASDKFIVGFLDECSPQTGANTVRRWAFEKPMVVKDTTKYKANTFGFYALGGVSVVDFLENSKKENFAVFYKRSGSRTRISLCCWFWIICVLTLRRQQGKRLWSLGLRWCFCRLTVLT